MSKSLLTISNVIVTLMLILTLLTLYKDSGFVPVILDYKWDLIGTGYAYEGQCEKKQKIMFLKTHKVNQTSSYCQCVQTQLIFSGHFLQICSNTENYPIRSGNF